MSESRELLVTDEILPYFLGWLEFAGHVNVPGIARCPEWPYPFTIEKIAEDDERGATRWLVTAERWPMPQTSYPEWCPVFFRGVPSYGSDA